MKNNLKARLLRVVLAVLAVVTGVLTSRAQTPDVSLHLENVTLKEFLNELQAVCPDYTFAYADSDLPMTRSVTVNADNVNVQTLLGRVLPGVTIKIIGSRLILTVAPGRMAGVMDWPPVRQIAGVVLDQEGVPLPGASIRLAGASNGVSSDADGRFVIDAGDGSHPQLLVSFIGYESRIICPDADGSFLKIELKPSVTALKDVVVVGYGIQNKRDVTTSISSLKAIDFETAPAPDFREAMTARLPGVQVISLGGNPEGNVSVRIRGIQSATSGNDPLYVIDGMTCDARAFSNLESTDIESLEVLKDASAAAVYGSRGSCGVVIVTTKRGRSGKTAVSYDGQVGFSTVSRKLDLLNAYEWAVLFKEARDGAYLGEVDNASIDDPYELRPQGYHRVDPLITSYLNDRSGALTDTDWQDQIFRTAITTKHAVSLSGSTPAINYYAGVNYLYREGVIINSDFERFGARVNLDGNIGKFKYGLSMSPSYSVTNHVNAESQYNHDGVVANALMCAPVFPVYRADGSYCWDMNGYLRTNLWDTQTTEVLNPVALAREVTDVRKKVNFIGNAYASYELFKGLEYRISLGGDVYAYQRNYYRPSYVEARGYRNFGVLTAPTATSNQNSYYHWTLANQLSYTAAVGDHNINVVAVHEAEKQTVNTSVVTGKGTPGDDKVRTTKGVVIDQASSYDDHYAYTFESWLLRASYSYKGRYMLSASLRGDGSSRFAPNSRWGYFPAISAGWRMSGESFLRNLTWMDDLKLRISIGQTGNAQIGNFEYLGTYASGLIDLGNGDAPSYYPKRVANDKLGWEKNTQYNAGVDMSVSGGYLQLTADAYYTRTTDMLFDVPVVSASGYTTNKVNVGSMQNKGIELMIGSSHSYGDFAYNVSFNWSLNRNKVTDLGADISEIIVPSSYSGANYITRIGQSVGCYYLLVQDGIFHNKVELDAYPHFSETQVGDFRFVDVNGNGVIEDDNDRTIVGNYMPDFHYGFTAGVSYRGLDVSAVFQGVHGNEIMNLERRYLLNMEASSNMMRESLLRWPYGGLNRANRKSTGRNGASISTFHIEDGSYLRLRNVMVGYTFPSAWTRRIHVDKLRVYFQGSNLITWTGYSGYNPEVNQRPSDAMSPGEDYCSYPLSRTFSFGVSFNL